MAAFDLALQMGCRHSSWTSTSRVTATLSSCTMRRWTRRPNGTGPVGNHTLAELRALDAGAWFGSQFTGERVPVYAEVLDRYRGQAHLHTELKGRAPHLASGTADLVRQYDMVDHVTVTSFQYPRLAEIRAYAPELPTGWLVSEVSDATIAQAHR